MFHTDKKLKIAGWLGVLLMVLSMAEGESRAQTAESLSQVRKLYVDSFGSGEDAAEMRARMIDRLLRNHTVQIVGARKEADAVVTGTGREWVTGYSYVSLRSKTLRQADHSGFLAVEVIGKNGQTLWSYLVTPSGLSLNITHNLVDQLASRLLGALKQGDKPSPSMPATSAEGEVDLRGAGATFPAPLYQLWIESFEKARPQTHISYDAVGSEAGIQRFDEGQVDFAGSDMPLSEARLSRLQRKVLSIPSVLGAVVPIYNVKGPNRDLNFTPDALAGIYLGEIRKWSDPLIKISNPGLTLPNAEIVVVHRSDGSGTSFVWTDYLSKISPEWKASIGSGTTIQWPLGVGAEHNEGVATTVLQTPNSIGYVELIYAIQHELSFGAVRNRAGRFIKASLSSVSTAAANSANMLSSDFRVSITDPTQNEAYPIASFTWLLLPKELNDAGKKTTLTALLHWVLTAGQKQCSVLGYTPLPSDIAKQALQALGEMQ